MSLRFDNQHGSLASLLTSSFVCSAVGQHKIVVPFFLNFQYDIGHFDVSCVCVLLIAFI